MKENIMQFLVWIRNGTAFCTTWFLIIRLVCCRIFDRQTLSADGLTRMLLLIVGGVFIFSIFFSRLFIKKLSFTKRLTCFIVSIGIYECAGFYLVGIFKGTGSLIQWGVFFGIICVLYFICIAIYNGYSKKRGEIYTRALENYQRQRREEHEK